MDHDPQTQSTTRLWALTIERFTEVAWSRHGATRYASVLALPILVAMFVPGWWWAGCALCAVAGMALDLYTHARFDRPLDTLKLTGADELKRDANRRVAAISLITSLYSAPYALLAFAPAPGPLVGLLYCAGAAVVIASLHVMTREMILFTIPVVAIGLVANAAASADPAARIVAAALGLTITANAIAAARAGARSFGDLIRARHQAELTAEELERRVALRTAELAKATRAAQGANRAKSVFLANMSHELRTPLNAVIGYSEIIEEDLASGDTAQSAADLAKIRSAAGHLLTLINEVLDLSRIESGKLELRPSRFDITALLRGALDTVKPMAVKHRTLCQFNAAPGVALANADETRVRQCVLNLLSNAAKFTQNGVIALDVRPCRIAATEGVAISVRDTGPGISAENLTRLFQPFSQIDDSRTRAHNGAGLGLVITRRLARAMGGDVVASSKLGEGSTFTLYLPVRSAASAQAAAA